MPALALVLVSIYLVLAFGVRTWLHYRRTGSTGFAGFAAGQGMLPRAAGALFAVAIVLGVLAPIAALVVPGSLLLASPVLSVAGVALTVIGTLATLHAQGAMRTSWRIGVEPGARTELITDGPYRWVRNPIFTAMSVASLGLALLCPTWLSGASLIALLIALEFQVRLVEEPWLVRRHGERYLAWAARTGRFLPGIGLLRA